MSTQEQEDNTIYKVVVNHEEQYSIWPEDMPNPLGWNDGGKSGLKAECLEYIKEVWTDMRPLSLRKRMAEAEKTATSGDSLVADGWPDGLPRPSGSRFARLGNHRGDGSVKAEFARPGHAWRRNWPEG